MTDGRTSPEELGDALDLAAIARDDAAIEALRDAARTGDLDLSFDDPALDLLAALVGDLGDDVRDLPVGTPGALAVALPVAVPAQGSAPVAEGATVLPLDAPSTRRRTVRRTAVATAVAAAGVVGIAGVAAAQPGDALRPFRDAFSDVFHGDAPFGSASDRRNPAPVASPSPTSTRAVPSAGSATLAPEAGASSSGTRRSASPEPSPSTARERAMAVRRQLDLALAAALAKRYDEATRHLDTAERLLVGGARLGRQRRPAQRPAVRCARGWSACAPARRPHRAPRPAAAPARRCGRPPPARPAPRPRRPGARVRPPTGGKDGGKDKPTKSPKATPLTSPKAGKSPRPSASPSPSRSVVSASATPRGRAKPRPSGAAKPAEPGVRPAVPASAASRRAAAVATDVARVVGALLPRR